MEGWCAICHKWGALERHHVFNGAFRSKSEEYGAVVEICRECHDDLHHHHPAKYVWLKREWQDKLMAWNEWTEDDSIREFGRNYL